MTTTPRLRMYCNSNDLPCAIGDDQKIQPVPTVVHETLQRIDPNKPAAGQFHAHGRYCYWPVDIHHRHDWTGVKLVTIPGVGAFLLLREHWKITCIDISPSVYVLANGHVQVTDDGKHSMIWQPDPPPDGFVDIIPRATSILITEGAMENNFRVMYEESGRSVLPHTAWADTDVNAWIHKNRSKYVTEVCRGVAEEPTGLFAYRPDLLIEIKRRIRQIKRWNEVV